MLVMLVLTGSNDLTGFDLAELIAITVLFVSDQLMLLLHFCSDVQRHPPKVDALRRALRKVKIQNISQDTESVNAYIKEAGDRQAQKCAKVWNRGVPQGQRPGMLAGSLRDQPGYLV